MDFDLASEVIQTTGFLATFGMTGKKKRSWIPAFAGMTSKNNGKMVPSLRWNDGKRRLHAE